ncbi:MurR/RpiR family transcriptional regulator [Aquamicrobium sp. LC103]|nr:MurR/RpiR family transcriptional regulator [Aquamicrobium sp. LC103]
MERGPLTELLIERFETLPPQLKVAARFVLDHPDDVALMSMREQAGQAGVSHSTMMRLARWLGLNGYEEMRALYAEALRESRLSGHADVLHDYPDGEESNYSTVGRVADTLAAQVAALGDYVNARQLLAAADRLASARRLFSLGFRREHAVAHHFASTLVMTGRQVALLDGIGGTGIELLGDAGPEDAMLAFALKPYARATVEIAQQAQRRGVAVVAVTDSSVSPLARLASESLIVTASSQSCFQSVVPALAAAEILAALIVARDGAGAEQALRAAEERLAALNVYWKSP